MLFIMLKITATTLVADNIIKDKKMNTLNIEKIELITSSKGTILSFNLCNTFLEKYYLEEGIISQRWEDTLYGYTLFQDGEKIPYHGTTKKRRVIAKKFPDGHIVIEPNQCMTVSANLSNFFNFNKDKEITIHYKRLNYQPSEVRLEKKAFHSIEFKTTLIATEKKEH